jgi:hypothetical protein
MLLEAPGNRKAARSQAIDLQLEFLHFLEETWQQVGQTIAF